MLNMLNFMKRRFIPCILSFLLVSMLTACQLGNNAAGSKEGQVTKAPTETPTANQAEPTKKSTEPEDSNKETNDGSKEETNDGSNEETNNASKEEANSPKENDAEPEVSGEPNIDDFFPVDTSYEDYTFDVTYDKTLQFFERTYEVKGDYDLDGDGKSDHIEAVLIADYMDGSYIEINGLKMDIDPFNPSGEMKIVDLNRKDNFKELAIFDEGPSADPAYIFYQYDGKEIHRLGTIDRSALMDGRGRLIAGLHFTQRFTPRFYSAWGEIKDGTYTYTYHDVKQYIGNTYEVTGSAFFVPMDTFPERYLAHVRWEPDTHRVFKATKVKLLDIYIDPSDFILNWFYVELPDGEKGLLYFWIGD